jgi:1-deoxy-D-xylulose 5-phosphate reductoisomerase
MRFEPLDPDRYPAFSTVLAAAREGGTALAAINAADEIGAQSRPSTKKER